MSSSPLPPYSATISDPRPPPLKLNPTPTPKPTPQTTHPSRPIPSINLLLLGSPGIGKSTFISQLPFVRDGALQPPSHSVTNLPSTTTTTTTTTDPSNPCTFDVSLFSRPYTISLHRSQSALFIDPFPDKIDALILCFAIDDKISLFNVRKYWKRVFDERYGEVPVMVLGLKRDLRSGRRTKREDGEGGEEYVCVMPEEGLEAAKDLFCDRYAECSAVTGELMFEVLEDVTRMAAGTTTEKGGFSQGEGCVVI